MSGSTRLILMRHAKSDWYSGEREDFLRPLNARGMRDARHIGRWLEREGLLPAQIVSSPSRRTRETLELVGEGAGVDLSARTRFLPALYLGTLSTLLEVLKSEAEYSDLMLVGHNPGLAELLDYLVDADARNVDYSKSFPTCAVYVLVMEGDLPSLAPHRARVSGHQRPKLLAQGM